MTLGSGTRVGREAATSPGSPRWSLRGSATCHPRLESTERNSPTQVLEGPHDTLAPVTPWPRPLAPFTSQSVHGGPRTLSSSCSLIVPCPLRGSPVE